MSLGLIITMGAVSVGGAIIERVLNKLGEADKASMIGIVSTSMLGATVVGSVIKVFTEVRKLGN